MSGWARRAVELRPAFLEAAGVRAEDVIARSESVCADAKEAGIAVIEDWVSKLPM